MNTNTPLKRFAAALFDIVRPITETVALRVEQLRLFRETVLLDIAKRKVGDNHEDVSKSPKRPGRRATAEDRLQK
jgi:hypothetical protein